MSIRTEQLHELMPWAADLQLVIVRASPGEVCGRIQWQERLCTAECVLHGGVLMGTADAIGAVCAFLNLSPGTTTTTIESKSNFFRAVREGYVEAVAKPLHSGRSTIVVQSNLSDERGRLVAQVTQTQAILPTPEVT